MPQEILLLTPVYVGFLHFKCFCMFQRNRSFVMNREHSVKFNNKTFLIVAVSNRGGLNLFQPRNKLEQFEDILLESQLLEAALPEVTASDSNFESVGFDFDASDAIFKDDDDDEEEEEDVVENEDNDCDCNTCKERMRHKDELLRLRQTWSEVREAVTQVYNLCMCDESREKPELLPNLKEKLRQLLWRDPHQLYQRLELIVKDFVLEQKVKLIKLLRSQAKNPSLAQDFIQSKF